jgi:hypothetical protein
LKDGGRSIGEEGGSGGNVKNEDIVFWVEIGGRMVVVHGGLG